MASIISKLALRTAKRRVSEPCTNILRQRMNFPRFGSMKTSAKLNSKEQHEKNDMLLTKVKKLIHAAKLNTRNTAA